jgi:hypothetical protein
MRKLILGVAILCFFFTVGSGFAQEETNSVYLPILSGDDRQNIGTPDNPPVITVVVTATPTSTNTPAPTPMPTATWTPVVITVVVTATPTNTPTATLTPTATPTPTMTNTPVRPQVTNISEYEDSFGNGTWILGEIANASSNFVFGRMHFDIFNGENWLETINEREIFHQIAPNGRGCFSTLISENEWTHYDASFDYDSYATVEQLLPISVEILEFNTQTNLIEMEGKITNDLGQRYYLRSINVSYYDVADSVIECERDNLFRYLEPGESMFFRISLTRRQNYATVDRYLLNIYGRQ